jgi:hypothetical protein
MKKFVLSALLPMINFLLIALFTIFIKNYFEGSVFISAILSWINALLLVKIIQIKQKKTVWLFLISFLLMYVLMIYSTLTFNAYLHHKLNSFDTNKDGIFSSNEQTEEQLRYMKIWANDVGRNLIWITAIFYSMISSILLELCLFCCRKTRKLINF